MTGSEQVHPEQPTSAGHPLDLFSLVAALVCLLVAGLYLLDELTSVEVEPGLVTAAAVVVLGGAGVLGALRRVRR
ncbi:MAG TPA: hypothetical protein VFR07_15005 [Mycobacteriales bacterium]|nr:hypothetical protein [Mycobacteriales bacterium]